MGLYEQPITKSKVTANEDGTYTWTETQDDLSSIRTRTVTASAWSEERYACYCCTCDAHDIDGASGGGMSDGYCRNHGAGVGERPCDIHNLPGQTIELLDGTDSGVFPMAVQAYREAVKNGEPTG